MVPPVEVARRLNRNFPLIEKSGQFFTFLYGVLDVESLVVRYVRAGHPGPIVANQDAVRCLEKGGGIPIGIMPEAEYEEERIQLAAGDSLVFYTDGVLETLNRHGEAFGLDRLVRCLTDARGGISEQLRITASAASKILVIGESEPGRRDDCRSRGSLRGLRPVRVAECRLRANQDAVGSSGSRSNAIVAPQPPRSPGASTKLST